MKVGQKRKADNTTHLLWKTIPMKLHLKKVGDGKNLENCVWDLFIVLCRARRGLGSPTVCWAICVGRFGEEPDQVVETIF